MTPGLYSAVMALLL